MTFLPIDEQTFTEKWISNVDFDTNYIYKCC